MRRLDRTRFRELESRFMVDMNRDWLRAPQSADMERERCVRSLKMRFDPQESPETRVVPRTSDVCWRVGHAAALYDAPRRH